MLKLIQTDWGDFDLALETETDEPTKESLETLIYAVLFTDQEAPKNRAEAYDRRGWYADPQAGSGIWHVRRQPLNSAARAEALATVRRAIKAKLPAVENISVTEEVVNETQNNPAGNVSRVSLVIAGEHNGRKFLIRAPL